jgi:DNA-binding YbaB/EbfC family protein
MSNPSDPNNPFGNIPGMPDLGALMQQAQRMRDQLVQSHATLAHRTVEASSGGGMVTAVVSGSRELVSVRIDPQVIDPKDPQMLQDLVVAAVNQGLLKAKSLEEDELRQKALSMGIPPGML